MRTAADAGQRRVEAGHADFQRRVDVGHREAARIVKVTAAEAIAGDAQRLLEQVAHHARIGVADGVGEAHAIGAGIEQRLHQAQHFRRRDAALERAAERGADAAFDEELRARRIARGANARDFRDHFVRRLAQVGEAVRVTGRQRHEQQVGAGFDARAARP